MVKKENKLIISRPKVIGDVAKLTKRVLALEADLFQRDLIAEQETLAKKQKSCAHAWITLRIDFQGEIDKINCQRCKKDMVVLNTTKSKKLAKKLYKTLI